MAGDARKEQRDKQKKEEQAKKPDPKVLALTDLFLQEIDQILDGKEIS